MPGEAATSLPTGPLATAIGSREATLGAAWGTPAERRVTPRENQGTRRGVALMSFAHPLVPLMPSRQH